MPLTVVLNHQDGTYIMGTAR